MTDALHAPVLYDPSVEHAEDGEAETSRGLNEALHQTLETLQSRRRPHPPD